MGQSIEAQNAILGSAKNIALSYGVSLRKVEGAYRRLGPAVLESGGTLKDTEGAIKSIAARTTMLGLNTEQAGRYIEAFAQVMGKGKLQGEELNQQFAELDGGLRGQLKNWLAANKGITDFEGAMKGEITSGVFLEAFEAINKEIRTKFLRSIGDTQHAIDTMGEKGGMTLNQLNAYLQTLTSIGMEGLGKALAPIGKELMKVYAAFIHLVFTKIATEMPGITALFQGLGHVIGVIVKVALNTVILGFGMLVKGIDLAVQLVMKLYEMIKKIPGIGHMLDGLEGAGAALNKNFDKSITVFSRLSDETTGAKVELEKYSDEMKMLRDQFAAEEITRVQYYQKVKELQDRQLEAKKKAVQDELTIEEDKMKTLLEQKNAQLQRDEQLMQRKIDGINRAKNEEIAAIDGVISNLERQKSTIEDIYNSKTEAVKRAAEVAKGYYRRRDGSTASAEGDGKEVLCRKS